MPKNKLITTLTGIPQDLESFGRSLANVTSLEGEREIVLGQAWLAGPNKLITCGHVVESYAQSPQQLVVKFPASGNRYVVSEIKLHPSFLKQKDQLVKFDAAALKVELRAPEKDVAPLSVRFERALAVNQSVYSVRYPAHLGMITASPSPLAQTGQILGHLRKHDNFHLLHDLALAQGDSGSPIFVGRSVVAIHCGDTASVPGLNLPTTSIRLALWIDALRELEIEDSPKKDDWQTQSGSQKWQSALLPIAMLLGSAILTAFIVLKGFLIFASHTSHLKTELPALPSVKIKIARAPGTIALPGSVTLGITAATDGKAYLLTANDRSVSFNPNDVFDLKGGQETSINLPPSILPESQKTTAPNQKISDCLKRFFLIITASSLDLSKEEWQPISGKDVSRRQFLNWLATFETAHKGQVLDFPRDNPLAKL